MFLRRALALALALSLSLGSTTATQVPLSYPESSPPVQLSEESAPLHLSSVRADTYTTLSHARFPHHRVRVKAEQLLRSYCQVAAYSFLLSWPGADFALRVLIQLLIVILELNILEIKLERELKVSTRGGIPQKVRAFVRLSRRPSCVSHDVVMWINGGPGCSSAMGLLMELGPCSIDMKNASANGTVWNPYSWNSEANIFFLDQPVGVGFSYADFGETVETTEDAAKNVYAFISLFFESFGQFKGRALHLSGESYGVGLPSSLTPSLPSLKTRIMTTRNRAAISPVFASYIYDQNQLATAAGRPTLNLQSVLIGNGITDISTLYPGRYDIECGVAALEVPFQSISTCVRMKAALPRCQKLMQAGCIDQFDAINCRAAVNFCDNELSSGMWASGRNVYDISKMCIGDLCYEENDAIAKYLSDPAVKELLGVDPHLGNFSACASDVGQLFNARLDKWVAPTQYYVAGLLDRGIRVLIYAGTYDWQCNWVANRMWVDKLEWSGKEAYAALEWADWGVAGTKAGEVKQSEGSLLSFVTIRDSD
ncbi:Carboxypeptidase [Mycena sanguinolenta]|uniref:carboxypeptidase C n=1 Tax=Mycena sanguinolenta TaxID=230812 RepID=A0A8H7DCF4_9AGAR|nr:Carboxypeptidase [Mycena sanguinolenta]